MVNIIERTQGENESEDRANRLVSIAKTVLLRYAPQRQPLSHTFSLSKKNSKERILVYPSQNRIEVTTLGLLNDAVKLARHYEFLGEPEFMVKRNY